ncbi:GntR family transcriptional regulator [soil metagenome]
MSGAQEHVGSAGEAAAPAPRVLKHEELRHELSAIIEGLSPHDPMPSERELMALYSVSRMTVRQAMAQLAVDGLVYRVQGSGTFVSDPAMVTKSLHLTSFSEDIRGRHMTPGGKLLTMERVPADAAIAQDLSLQPGADVIHVERCRTADGVPMCVENVWLPASLAGDLLDVGLGDSLYEFLAEAGLEPESADQRIRATVLDPREAKMLAVPPYSPALVVTRVTYDGAGVPVERALSLYRADRYDFQLTVTRSDSKGHR